MGRGEREAQGRFPDIDSAQIQYRIAPSFLLNTCPCIVFGRRPLQCTSLRLNDTHVGIVFRFVSVTAFTFAVLEVLYVFCLTCDSGASDVENNNKDATSSFVWKSVPWCKGTSRVPAL
jgi:hypothetical protein